MTTDDTRDRLAAEDVLANALYVAVVNPDTIWWDDLTPEMQDGWRRGARAAALSLADAPVSDAERERWRALDDDCYEQLRKARADAPDEGLRAALLHIFDMTADRPDVREVARTALDRLNEEGAG